MSASGERESENKKRCANCIFYLSLGQCVRFPPTVASKEIYCASGSSMCLVSTWPEVKKDDWCGEFKEK